MFMRSKLYKPLSVRLSVIDISTNKEYLESKDKMRKRNGKDSSNKVNNWYKIKWKINIITQKAYWSYKMSSSHEEGNKINLLQFT